MQTPAFQGPPPPDVGAQRQQHQHQQQQHQQQHQQHHQQRTATTCDELVKSFAVRLMSLDNFELGCLNADPELMGRFEETKLLLENKLQDIHSLRQTKFASVLANDNTDSLLRQQQQQLSEHLLSSQNSPLNLNLRHNQFQLLAANEQQQQQSLLAAAASQNQADYYHNYYAQQLALAQMQQQQHRLQQQQHHHHQHHNHHQQQQQQQQMLLYSRYCQLSGGGAQIANEHMMQLNDISGANTPNSIDQHPIRSSAGGAAGAAEGTPSPQQRGSKRAAPQAEHHPPHQLLTVSAAPALDLRTTPTRPMSALTASPSPVGRAGSAGSANSSHLSIANFSQQQHPKKLKLSEYRRMQQSAERGAATAAAIQRDLSELLTAAELDAIHDQNRRPPSASRTQKKLALNQLETGNNNNNSNSLAAKMLEVNKRQSGSGSTLGGGVAQPTAPSSGGGKKYKGEFDEPTPGEVKRREHELYNLEHYHRRALELTNCACVLGSEFEDKSTKDVLEMIENWRLMEVDQRTKWKWDVNDLPKDIPLSNIKKFEDLRREFSEGRADFGGASKRKPLGIRGTRQFLLILYCLWGHPGRDDPMQRDGYCPHCFAKIKKANEQSTLVRVVNHFNMKHRRGANPRLSPHLSSSAAAAATANSNSASPNGLSKVQTSETNSSSGNKTNSIDETVLKPIEDNEVEAKQHVPCTKVESLARSEEANRTVEGGSLEQTALADDRLTAPSNRHTSRAKVTAGDEQQSVKLPDETSDAKDDGDKDKKPTETMHSQLPSEQASTPKVGETRQDETCRTEFEEDGGGSGPDRRPKLEVPH